MMVSLLGNKSGKTLESAMNKALLTLAAVVAISTGAQAKDNASRDHYMCLTMHTKFVEAGIERNAEFKQNLLDKYNFNQDRIDITYDSFKDKFQVLMQYEDMDKCWVRN